MKRALGYLPDPHDPRDFRADRLLGQPVRPDLVVPASMMQYRVGAICQGRASSCVAHALQRAIDMALRYHFARGQNETAIDPPRAARRFIYYNARRQEVVDALRRGLDIPHIEDVGCMPRLAMRAVQRLGFCDEAMYPYSDDEGAINMSPPPSMYRAAIDQSGFTFARAATAGVSRVADVARGLAQGVPSIFGMFVDTAFMENKGEVIQKVDLNDPHGGGHMLTVLEVTSSEVVFDNWWSPLDQPDAWGKKGIGRMTHELFGSSAISDVYLIKTVPTFSENQVVA